MNNLIKMESYNLKKLKSYKILVSLSILFSIFVIIAYTFDVEYNPTGRMVYNNLLWDTPLMMIYLGILAGIFVGADFNFRTNSLQVARGHSRKSIVLSKLIVYLIGCVPLLLLPIIIQTVYYSAINTWGVAFDVTQLIYIAKTLSLSIFLNMATASIFFTLAYLFKDIAKTSIVSIVGYILLAVVLELFGKMNENLNFYKYTTLSLAREVNDIVVSGMFVQPITIGIITVLLMTLASINLFNKSELK